MCPGKGEVRASRSLRNKARGHGGIVIAQSEKTALKNQLEDINRQIESLLDRVVEANNASVVSAYEDKIDKLERDKFVLQEKIDKAVPYKGRLEDCIEPSLRFLASPWRIYKNGDFAMRQPVLRLAFAEPLRYAPNEMYRTPEFSFPFRYLGGFLSKKARWCCRRDSNSRPLPYQGSALPLSYGSARGGALAPTAPPCKPRLDGF